MEEEAVHPLDQLIAATRKADADKSEPVFTVDEKGRMTENRGKQESTATTRKKNTDVVFKQTSTMPGKGYRKIDGEQLLRFLSQDAIIAGESPDVKTFFPRVANEKGNFVKSKVPLEINPNALYWWKDNKRMVHSMVDTELQNTLFEAQRSDLQGTGKNVSDTGAIRGDEGLKQNTINDASDYVYAKYKVPSDSIKFVLNSAPSIVDPVGEAAELMAIKLGIPGVKNWVKGELSTLILAAIGSATASAFQYNAKKVGTAEAFGALSMGVYGVPPYKPATEVKEFTPDEEAGVIVDSLLTGMETFVNILNHLPALRLTMEAEERIFNDEDGYFGFMGDKLKSVMGAFTDE